MLFAIGTAGVFLRRNLITILLSIEIMLNAVNLTFVAFGRALGSADGQIIVFFVMTVAAAEAAVGLAHRHRAVPPPRIAQPRLLHEPEMVRPDGLACPVLALIPLLPFARLPAQRQLRQRLSQGDLGRRGRARRCSASFGVSLASVVAMLGRRRTSRAIEQTVFTWITSGDLNVGVRRFRLDPLSSVMILVITGIGSLIHIYSTAYMHEETDTEYARYFSYLNLFAAFMLVLVLGSNFLGDVRRLGGRRPVLVPADRLLVPEEVGLRRRQEGVHRQPHRRLRRSSSACCCCSSRFGTLDFQEVARDGRGAAGRRRAFGTLSVASRCCCSSARPASRRRFRSTSGCPTRWKARRRSPR